MGAEMILPVFSDIISRSRSILPITDSVKRLFSLSFSLSLSLTFPHPLRNDEQLVMFMMKHFSMPKEAAALSANARLGEAVSDVSIIFIVFIVWEYI